MTPLGTHLARFDAPFTSKARVAGVAALVASFLIVSSLIVAMGALICLTLPGVNVMRDVVWRGVMPAVAGLTLSIPFIVISYLRAVEKRDLRRSWMGELREQLEGTPATNTQEESSQFILNNFVDPKWSKEYKGSILQELTALYPKKEAEQTPDQKRWVEALKLSLEEIYKKPKKV